MISPIQLYAAVVVASANLRLVSAHISKSLLLNEISITSH